MQSVRPGSLLRPHVKAFKSTEIAGILKQGGYSGFCCATIRELEGLVANGLGDDLLLANETLNASRLRSLVDHGAQVIVAVDSTETIDAAKDGGIRNVLIDVNVGLPRCGCDLKEVETLSVYARRKGLNIQGVMGYEGHLMFTPDRTDRKEGVAKVTAEAALCNLPVLVNKSFFGFRTGSPKRSEKFLFVMVKPVA